MPENVLHLNEEDHALLIGIDNYLFLDPLKGAQDDIAKFQKWLIDENGGAVPPKNIHTVLSPVEQDDEDPQPVQDKINQKLRKIGVMKGRRIGRRLYFYFSGHGYGTIDDVAMLMGNASPFELKNNIGLRNYRNFLLQWGFFDEIIFILDCCRDPIRHAETGIPSFTLPENMIPNPPPKVTHYTILACPYGEKSFMVPQKPGDPEKRGILSTAIFEGLMNRQATDASGDVTINSLMDYLHTRVPQLAGDNRINQQPEFDALRFQQNITLQKGPLMNQTIAIFLPATVNKLAITNKDAVEIAEYNFTNNAWDFRYLTAEADKQKYVLRIDETAAPPAEGNGTIIRLKLIQNCWYDLECSDGKTEILDLRKIPSNDINHVFRFKQ
ncbi:caspase family protein [Niastella caeni]|uniref:Caspase family protein n=1 Tax=Niastella caeni TaxID=2569763 RepID=A0A4S8HZD3_9BACT|nr:caspase family protein [Niastella caeni]THU41173.1 caspase family protein [Niastella caeni]